MQFAGESLLNETALVRLHRRIVAPNRLFHLLRLHARAQAIDNRSITFFFVFSYIRARDARVCVAEDGWLVALIYRLCNDWEG